MVRGIADALALFLLPFAVYGLMLVLRRRLSALGPRWTSGRLAMLSVAGLVLVIVALLLFGLAAPRPAGVYVPAHIEDGRLVPGLIR